MEIGSVYWTILRDYFGKNIKVREKGIHKVYEE
jgi:hypothetical protein